MAISVGALGGNTDVRITPNHGFDQVAPRLAYLSPLPTL